MRFPNFYKALTDNELTIDSMGAVLIEEGKIILVTGNYIAYSDFGLFVSNPELANERLLDKDMLKWMATKKIKSLECTHSEIIATYKDGTTESRHYSGHIDTDGGKRVIYMNGETKNAIFPNWKSVIPSDIYTKKCPALKQIGIDYKRFSKLMECFTCEDYDYLVFEFTKPNQAIRVSVKSPYGANDYSQCGLMMPYEIK